MRVVDEVLEDDELLEAVYNAQGKRHPRSRKLGRPQTPAEVALRMLILKHVLMQPAARPREGFDGCGEGSEESAGGV